MIFRISVYLITLTKKYQNFEIRLHQISGTKKGREPKPSPKEKIVV